MTIADKPVITVRPKGTHPTKQRLPNFEGISADTAVVARNDPNEQESVVTYQMSNRKGVG